MNPSEEKEEMLGRQLRAQLRETTPEFETRFDALRRTLALEKPRRRWFGFSPAWTGAGIGAAAAAIVIALLLRPEVESPPPGGNPAGYGELIMLNEALSGALVLADAELLEAVMFMPADAEVGS